MTPRELGKQQRRERIIDAARAIIVEEGIENLSTRKIANHADLSVHTLYSLVGNKQDILHSVIAQNHLTIGQEIDARDSDDPIGQIFATIDGTYHILRNDPAQRALMLALSSLQKEARSSPAMNAILDDAVQRLHTPVASAISSGILGRAVSSVPIAVSLNAAFNSHLVRYLDGRNTLEQFLHMSRFSFWLSLCAVATPRWRTQFLANALAESAILGYQ